MGRRQRQQIRTGIDLCDVAALRAKLQRAPAFRDDLFSAQEVAYCEAQPDPYPHYAARFAAKEAFCKAFGLDLLGLELPEIAIEHDRAGRPRYRLSVRFVEETLVRAGYPVGSYQLDLSLSHEPTMAVASVVALLHNVGGDDVDDE